MKTQLETLSSVKKKITIDLPVERVVEALEKAYQKIQKKAKIKGFREGKVPRNLLEIHFKKDAEGEAVEALIDSSFYEAIKNEAVNPVSRPQITPGPFQKDAPFSYTAEFEVNPIVEIKEYQDLPLEKTEREVGDEHVEKRLAAFQQSMTQLEPSEEGAKVAKGFVAFVDFSGTAEGKVFKGSQAENFLVDIGAGSLLPAFEEQIIGMAKGESKKIEFDYPKDYFNKDLAGKHGLFNVTVKELKIKRVPELNDDFARDLGNYKTLADVKDDIRKRVLSAVESEAKRELANQALDVLVKRHQFEIPESLVFAELKVMFESFVRQLTQQGKKFEDTGIKPEQFVEQYRPVAEGRVRGYYILDSIAKTENIQVSDADADERLNLLAAQVKQPVDKVKEYYMNNDLINGLKIQVLHEKTLDFVVSKARIKTKKGKR